MNLHFYKYQATGNDFILVDNRGGGFSPDRDQIIKACDRRFGIGADGLILLEKDAKANFGVNYFNSDGSQSLCGNGSRAAVQFASFLGLINGKATFSAYDGLHDAELLANGEVRLKMNPVSEVEKTGDDYIINTGSPHYVRFVQNLDDFAVFEEGKKVRYSARFRERGINVNFVERRDNGVLFVRTYERGVEDETLSCGTGVTAAALAAHYLGNASPAAIVTRGGNLSVEYETPASKTPVSETPLFDNIFLIGPAKMVFEGDLEL